MRKASRIYKRKSRSNLETLIIFVGAIIILGSAFYLARERSYIPPEEQTTFEEIKKETSAVDIPTEIPEKITVEEVNEEEKYPGVEGKKEITPPLEKPSTTEPTVIEPSRLESETSIIKESEIISDKKVYTIQVGAFSAEKNALNLSKEIKEKGFQTYVVKGQTLYKVQVGEFKSYQEAQDVSQKLKVLGYPIFITTRWGKEIKFWNIKIFPQLQ